MDYPEKERELRERFIAEPHLCVACDEIARSRDAWEKGKPAYKGGVYHVLLDVTREPSPTPPNGRPDDATH